MNHYNHFSTTKASGKLYNARRSPYLRKETPTSGSGTKNPERLKQFQKPKYDDREEYTASAKYSEYSSDFRDASSNFETSSVCSELYDYKY